MPMVALDNERFLVFHNDPEQRLVEIRRSPDGGFEARTIDPPLRGPNGESQVDLIPRAMTRDNDGSIIISGRIFRRGGNGDDGGGFFRLSPDGQSLSKIFAFRLLGEPSSSVAVPACSDGGFFADGDLWLFGQRTPVRNALFIGSGPTNNFIKDEIQTAMEAHRREDSDAVARVVGRLQNLHEVLRIESHNLHDLWLLRLIGPMAAADLRSQIARIDQEAG
jgi:hypothetical protein